MSHTSDHAHGCRVSDEWTLRGMRAAVLENELLRVVVLVDKGADIVEFRYKPLDLDPLLRLPGGPRNPYVGLPSIAPPLGPFPDYYYGGWQEILPSGGEPSTYKGVDYGQHGEVTLVPWSCEVLEDAPERVAIRCVVRPLRTPLRLERTMTLERGRAALILDERLTNEAGEPLDVMWGHHVAFGLPFLQEGARIASSATRLLVHEELAGVEPRRLRPGQQSRWPEALSAEGEPVDMRVVPARTDPPRAEIAYLAGFEGPSWYAITNPARRAGFAMRWDGDLFRYVWQWEERSGARGYPWWGRTYAVALEPWTGYPTLGLAEAVARGAQLTLAPGQTIDTHLVASMYDGVTDVAAVEEDGSVRGA